MELRLPGPLSACFVITVFLWPQLLQCTRCHPAKSASRRRPTAEARSSLISVNKTRNGCDAGELLFGGTSCHPAFTRGHPCPDAEWLVKSARRTEPGVGRCRKRPCPRGKYLWTVSESPVAAGKRQAYVCAEESFGYRACREGQRPHASDEDGTGWCDCRENFVHWLPADACFRLLTRGPCRKGEILFYDPVARFLSCQTNPCDREEAVLWDDGKCYDLYSTGPCPPDKVLPGNETKMVWQLQMNTTTLEVECASSIILVAPPQNVYYSFIPSLVPARRKNCANNAPGVALSTQCAGKSGTIVVTDSSHGCAKGYFRDHRGGCASWKSRAPRPSQDPLPPQVDRGDGSVQ